MNVFDFFQATLGKAPTDATLRDLDTLSPCGRDCMAAINAAKVFGKHAHDALDMSDDVIELCNEIVSVYWRG